VYEPSYTPAQHVARGELWALVDPNDLHQPLENTDWFAPTEQIAAQQPKGELTDQTIRKIFESHGQYLSGKDLAMLRVIELMLKEPK
jgi:hypothetical protein